MKENKYMTQNTDSNASTQLNFNNGNTSIEHRMLKPIIKVLDHHPQSIKESLMQSTDLLMQSEEHMLEMIPVPHNKLTSESFAE